MERLKSNEEKKTNRTTNLFKCSLMDSFVFQPRKCQRNGNNREINEERMKNWPIQQKKPLTHQLKRLRKINDWRERVRKFPFIIFQSAKKPHSAFSGRFLKILRASEVSSSDVNVFLFSPILTVN